VDVFILTAQNKSEQNMSECIPICFLLSGSLLSIKVFAKMNLTRKRMILRRILDADLCTDKKDVERLEIQPMAGDYHLVTKRWRDPCEFSVTLQQWEEVWFSKVLAGDYVQFNRGIVQLNMQERAKAYPAISDGGAGQVRRSMIFVKNPDDILFLKMTA
jgi:hypothetical protein